jgi:hypothetical protein
VRVHYEIIDSGSGYVRWRRDRGGVRGTGQRRVLREPGLADLLVKTRDRISATTIYGELRSTDLTFICVNTR